MRLPKNLERQMRIEILETVVYKSEIVVLDAVAMSNQIRRLDSIKQALYLMINQSFKKD